MEQIFEGYAPACNEAALQSRKQRDKYFYVVHKITNGVRYFLTDKVSLGENVLQCYKNGMITEMPSFTVEEAKPVVVDVKKEEPIFNDKIENSDLKLSDLINVPTIKEEVGEVQKIDVTPKESILSINQDENQSIITDNHKEDKKEE